ncbi:MAG TPA: cytochrome C biogenesis protein, partial [Chryseosolibacter sp.]|nr:cytochrome C biogenesis protein [Chryseosolibacter sp.]
NRMIGRVPSEIRDLAVQFTINNIHPETNEFSISIQTRQKDYIIIKAMEKPWINVLWIGTGLLLAGFTIATVRRYGEFKKMKLKGQE